MESQKPTDDLRLIILTPEQAAEIIQGLERGQDELEERLKKIERSKRVSSRDLMKEFYV